MSELDLLKSLFADMVEFVQHNLTGHWIVNILLFIYMIVTTLICCFETNIHSMSKPLRQWRVWMFWLFAGLWGSHWEYLNPHVRKDLYPNKNSELVDSWFGLSFLSVTSILVLLTFNLFEAQYNVVVALLLVLLFFNVLLGLVCIPYSTAKFNAIYYRRNIETDLILQNKRLPVDEHIIEFDNRLTEFGENLKIVDAIVGDSDAGKEDANTSFFKNLVTFGNYNKLQREKGRLKMLADTLNALNEEIEKNVDLQYEMEVFLEQYRVAAYRNISLCKELLGLLKKIEGEKQKVIKDIIIDIPQTSSSDLISMGNFKDVEFNVSAFEDSVSATVEDVGKKLSAIQDKGKKITSTDLATSAIEIGLSAVVEGFSGIIDLNADTSNQRAEVQHNISYLTDELERLVPKLTKYKVEILRQIELLSALKEMNAAFIKVYEPLRKSVYSDTGGFVRGYREFITAPEARKQLGLLAAICSNYSKVNNSR